MNLEQRISNLERNSSKTAPGAAPTYGRLELVNTASAQSINHATIVRVGNGTGTTAWTVAENSGGVFTHLLGRVTCTKAGRYSVWTSIRWDTSNSQNRQITIKKNAAGTGVDLAGLYMPTIANIRMAVSTPSIRLAANDTLEIEAYQDSGTPRTLAALTSAPLYFIVEYLGA